MRGAGVAAVRRRRPLARARFRGRTGGRSTTTTSPRAPTTSSSAMAGIARLGRKPPYEYEIHTIGVDAAYQGQGIGRRLLTGLLDYANGGTVFLEVRTDNDAAIAPVRERRFRRGRAAQAVLPRQRRRRLHACDGIRHDDASDPGHRKLLRRNRCRHRASSTTTARSRCWPTRWPPASTSTPGSAAWSPRSRRAHTWRRWAPPCGGRSRRPAWANPTSSPPPSARVWPVRCWWEWLRPRHIRRRGRCRSMLSTISADTWPPTSTTMARCPRALGCWCPAGTPTCCTCGRWANRSSNSAAPSTTLLARRTTRSRGCSALVIPAASRSMTWPATGDRDAIVFPRGMTGPRDDPYAFSFSGLKTAVARYVESQSASAFRAADVAAGFQEAVADVLTHQGGSRRHRAWGVDAADRRWRGGQLAAARAGRPAVRGRGADAADPAATAVHRQRRDDRLVRRASDRRRRAAVAAGRSERSGPAGGEGTAVDE